MAARQRGPITRAQLLAAGVTRRAIDGLVRDGWLHRVHKSVYAIGHSRLDREARWLAATLATDGVLSHRSAAELWGLLAPRAGPAHVTRSRPGKRLRPGIVLHEGSLDVQEVTRRHGVPCTSLVRTLIDLAGQVSRAELARAFDQVQVQHHLRPAIVLAALVQQAGRRGTRALQELLADAVDPGEIDSLLELRFLQFCEAVGLPRPRTPAEFGAWTADFFFGQLARAARPSSRARRAHPRCARRVESDVVPRDGGRHSVRELVAQRLV